MYSALVLLGGFALFGVGVAISAALNKWVNR